MDDAEDEVFSGSVVFKLLVDRGVVDKEGGFVWDNELGQEAGHGH